MDGGRLLAVKIIKAATGNMKQLSELKREVEILAGVSHVSTSFSLRFGCLVGAVS